MSQPHDKKSGLEKDVLDYASGIKKQLEASTEDVSEFIKKYPLTSVAVAAGIGILLGKLLNRRKK